MRKAFTHSILVISFLFFSYALRAQITSAGSGNWSNTSTWVGGVVPTSADNVVIAAGHTVAVDDATAACNNLSFGDATSKLNMSTATSVLSIYGNFTQAGDLHVVFTGWVPGAKVKFTGPAATQTISGSTGISSATYIPPSFSFNELQIDKPLGTTVLTPDGAANTAGNVLAIANSLEIISGRLLIGTRSDLEGKDLTNAASPAAYIATKPTITVQAAGTFEMNGVNAHIRSGQFSVATPADGDNAKIGLMTVFGSAIMRPNQAQGISFLGITVEAGATMDIKSGNNANFNPGSILVKTNGTFIYSSTGASTVWYNNTVTPTTVFFETGSTYEFGSVQSQASTYVPPAPGLTLTHPMYVRYANATTGLTPDTRFASYSNLVLIGSAKALAQHISVSDTLFMRTTATSAPAITLSGFTLTYGANATLQYRGIGAPPFAQTTTDVEWPTSGSMPKNVSLFNSRGVTLNNTKSITGQLSFMNDSSLLKIGNNSITVNSTTGQGRLRFVPITGTGTLTIRQVGNTATTFPVGISDDLVANPNAYKPVTITNNGTADDFTVKVAAGQPCAVPAAQSVNAIWNIAEATPGGSSSNLQFQWYGTDENAGFIRTSCAVTGCDVANTVTTTGASAAATGNDPYTVSATGVSSFYNFGVKNSDGDMSATALVAPTDGGCKTTTETVTVTVTNNSASAIDFSINNVTVNVTATGGYSSSYVINTSTLAAGATQNVTMPATIDMSAGGAFVFNASTVLGGDVNTANDAMAPVTINAAVPPAATISYSGSPFCSNAAVQNVTLTGSTGGTFSSTAGLTIDASTGDITPATSTAGTYTVTYTIAAANGCQQVQATASVTITELPAPTIAYNSAPYCEGPGTASPTLTGTTGGVYAAAPGGLTIDPSTGVIDLATSTPANYLVTYTIAAANGCSQVVVMTPFTLNPQQTAGFNYGGQTTFCQSGANPSATITGTAGGTFTATPAGLVFANATTGEIDVAATAVNTYTITYTTAGPCGASSSMSVSVTNAPSASFSYADPAYCSNGTNPLPVFGAGASAGVFSAAPAGLSINASTGEINLAASTPGTYTVTNFIAPSGGCAQATATTSVTITQLPAATISYSGPFCVSLATPQPVTLTGTTGGTFSAPAGLTIDPATGDVTPSTSTPGTYTVTYTVAAAGGCSAVSTTTQVTINNNPSATITYIGSPFCNNSSTPHSVTLSGTTGGTFSSTAGLSVDVATGSINAATSTPGTYTVTYTIPAGGGCPLVTATASVTITALPAATISYAGTPFCASVSTAQPVTLTGTTGGVFGATPGLTINGATGAITPSTSTPGTYTVSYTIGAASGCPSVVVNTTVTVTAVPTAAISYAGSPFCSTVTTAQPVTQTGATSGTYTAAPSGLTINASTGAITPSTSTPGTYTVTYTIPAQGGCAAVPVTTSVTITAAPTAAISYAGTPFCTSGGTATVTQTGSAGGTYSAPAGLIINASTGALTLGTSTPGTYTVTYTVAAAGGCAAISATTSVTVNAISVAPTGVTLSKTTSCGATTVNLAVTGGTLAPGASWKWYSGTCGGTAVGTGATVNNVAVSATTTFFVRAEGGLCGNSTCASATITIFTVPTITLSYQTDSLVWPLQTKNILATATPAVTGNVFEWYKNAAIVPGVTGSTITVDADNVGLYTAKVTTPDGCSATTATGRLISGAYKENLWIYPNPTGGKFTVRYFNDRPVPVSRTLVITDPGGRRVYEAKFIQNGPYSAMNVDLSAYPKGMYILSVHRSDGPVLISGKIMIQ